MQATDIHGQTFKNGTATLLARIVGQGGAAMVQADVSSSSYTIYLLDDQDADSRTPVAGHTDVELTVGAVMFTSLQTDGMWTVDDIGYNFRHLLDVAAHQAFSIAGRRYLVEYRLVPAGGGQVIVVRFRMNVI